MQNYCLDITVRVGNGIHGQTLKRLQGNCITMLIVCHCQWLLSIPAHGVSVSHLDLLNSSQLASPLARLPPPPPQVSPFSTGDQSDLGWILSLSGTFCVWSLSEESPNSQEFGPQWSKPCLPLQLHLKDHSSLLHSRLFTPVFSQIQFPMCFKPFLPPAPLICPCLCWWRSCSTLHLVTAYFKCQLKHLIHTEKLPILPIQIQSFYLLFLSFSL